MAVIKEDDRGIFVQAGGYVARPGDAVGYAHAYDMSAGGLVKGDRVAARHLSGTPLIRIKIGDAVLHWKIEKGGR